MSIEEIELSKKREALIRDVEGLVDKYLRIMEWDIPEVDESQARRLILAEIRQAVSRLEG